MLDQQQRLMLINAAETKDIEAIDRVIDFLKIMSPKNFLLTEQDMKQRVFHHRPFGMQWSGDYRVDKIF
jgi:hypothetical protein